MVKGRLSYTLMDEPLPPSSIQWWQSTQGKGWNKREKRLLLNNLPAFGQIGCLVLTVETEEGTWASLGPFLRVLNSMGLVCRILGWTAVLVVLYGGKPTELDWNTLQRLCRCHVIYVDNIATEVLLYMEMLHKQVKVRMENSSKAPPHKFTDLCREVLEIIAVLPPDDPWYGKKVVFAFDAIVPIRTGTHSGSAILTFCSDCKYAIDLARKMKKSPPAWLFGYLRTIHSYNLPTVQSLMESFDFDTQQALFSRYSTFDLATLVVDTEFGETDEQLESMEADLGIDQGWEVDREVSDGRGFAVDGYQAAMEKTTQDHIEDIDDANRRGPSWRSDFSQSTGNSINDSTAMAWMAFTHKERALQNLLLHNINLVLQNDLTNERSRIAAITAQLHLLQTQLAAQDQGQGLPLVPAPDHTNAINETPMDTYNNAHDNPMDLQGALCTGRAWCSTTTPTMNAWTISRISDSGERSAVKFLKEGNTLGHASDQTPCPTPGRCISYLQDDRITVMLRLCCSVAAALVHDWKRKTKTMSAP